MDKNLLIIFTRNPELGKCKTRLARKVGDVAALEIYQFLLQHTFTITKDLDAKKWVFYSEEIWEDDIWDKKIYQKHLQQGKDLGERMMHAFSAGFEAGFENIIIIGSDMFDLDSMDLQSAFGHLQQNDFVIGPAVDGGYYLLGMKSIKPEIFQNKLWGTNTVLSDTLKDLETTEVYLLPEKNDVDYYEDIKDVEAFQPFLKHMKS